MSKNEIAEAQNELFAVIEAGNYHKVKAIFKRYKYKKQELRALVNERDNFGTNALGKAFLESTKFKDDFLKVVELFVLCEEFDVNAYLNNKTGMDSLGNRPEITIGGFSVLHMALHLTKEEGWGSKILILLEQRNNNFGWVNTDISCNFKYQSLNPKYHMHSPLKLAQKSNAPHINQLLELQERQTAIENDDSSGDSDTEGTPAYYYKKHFQKLTIGISGRSENSSGKDDNVPEPEISQSKNQDEDILIPHFHGVRFVDGHYTNAERREIFEKIMEFNKRSLEQWSPVHQGGGAAGREHNPMDNSISAFDSIYSRTLTLSCGIENLCHISQLQDFRPLQRTDNLLNSYLSDCFKKNTPAFLETIKTYVYNFKNESSQENFWKKLAEIMEPPQEIIKYRFPLISTSKAPDHATKFAWGHNIEDLAKGEKPLNPYYKNGYPAHRFTGFVSVTLHSASEIGQLLKTHQLVDMPSLLATKHITTRQPRIDNKNEVMFFSSMKHNVMAIIPLIYPNLSERKKFDGDYHGAIWDMSLEVRADASNFFSKAQDNFQQLGTDKTEQAFPKCYDSNGNINIYGKVLMPGFVKLAADLAKQIATTQGKFLCYQFNDKLYKYLSIYVKNGNRHFSATQLQITDLRKGSPSKAKKPKENSGPEGEVKLKKLSADSSDNSSSSSSSSLSSSSSKKDSESAANASEQKQKKPDTKKQQPKSGSKAKESDKEVVSLKSEKKSKSKTKDKKETQKSSSSQYPEDYGDKTDSATQEPSDGEALFDHQEASSWHKYWYKYSKSAMNELLKLRIESAGISDDTQIISPRFSFDGSSHSAAKLANEISSQLLKNKALVVLNLYNKHWVGLAVDTSSDKVTVTYMDSEQTAIPEELKIQLSDAINKAKPEATISVIETNLEVQKYNNCGPEVIENFIAYLTGHRLPQDDAIIAHSALLEESAMLIGATD